MPAEYTVIAARNAGTKPNPHGGELVKWYLRLADSEAGEEDVYTQKKPGNDLSPGMSIYGRVEKGDYGWRFFSEQREDGAPAASGPIATGPTTARMNKDDYWRAKDQRDIESQARMGRAHAQEMAIRWSAIVGNDKLDQLQTMTDIFHQDVQRFPLDADVGGGAPQGQATASPPALPPAADVSAEREIGGVPVEQLTGTASPQLKAKATQLMNKAGLAKESRQAVIMFRCGTLKDPPATELRALVGDLEEGATHDTLLAEVIDAKRAGNPLGARAAAMIPSDVPNAEPPPEEVKDGEDIPF